MTCTAALEEVSTIDANRRIRAGESANAVGKVPCFTANLSRPRRRRRRRLFFGWPVLHLRPRPEDDDDEEDWERALNTCLGLPAMARWAEDPTLSPSKDSGNVQISGRNILLCYFEPKFAEKARSGGGLDLGSCISMLPAFCANPCYTAMSDAFSPELAVLSAIM